MAESLSLNVDEEREEKDGANVERMISNLQRHVFGNVEEETYVYIWASTIGCKTGWQLLRIAEKIQPSKPTTSAKC